MRGVGGNAAYCYAGWWRGAVRCCGRGGDSRCCASSLALRSPWSRSAGRATSRTDWARTDELFAPSARRTHAEHRARHAVAAAARTVSFTSSSARRRRRWRSVRAACSSSMPRPGSNSASAAQLACVCEDDFLTRQVRARASSLGRWLASLARHIRSPSPSERCANTALMCSRSAAFGSGTSDAHSARIAPCILNQGGRMGSAVSRVSL